jgi:NAD(P)-dependent dehydrogenase (short-subunit alcohol dehydrogenase family)
MRVPDPDRRNLLEGKVCLITGGGGSLGLATAKLFLKEGARVVLADRDAAALKAAQSSLDDVNVSSVVADPTVEADVAGVMDAVIDRHGRLDVIVANAAAPVTSAPITECDVDEFDRTLAVRVRAVFLVCKHGLRVLGDGGSVVILSGVAGLRADAGAGARAAAEHAQVGLMRSVAKEAAPRRIRVNTIHPGPVAREFQAGTGDAAASVDQQIPLGRHARPEEVARSVLYLASAQSSFTTGSTLVVDGGLSA